MAEQPPTNTADESSRDIGGEKTEQTEKGAATGLLAGLGCGTVSLLLPASFGAFAILVILVLALVRGCG